jgi:hypothetical protein
MAEKPNEYDDLAGELYDLTKTDWGVEASCVITEPVCWVISIAPDGPRNDGVVFPSLNGFIGTGNVAETIRLGIDKLIRTIKANAQDI